MLVVNVLLIIAGMLMTIIATSKYHKPLAGLISGIMILFYGIWQFFNKAVIELKKTDTIWEIENLELSMFCWPFITVLIGVGCIVLSVILFSFQKIKKLELNELEKLSKKEDTTDS